MASITDDLDELIDGDELSEHFAKASNHIQKLLSNISNDNLLMLYGYYKQGTCGECDVPKPSWYDVRGKAKWEAWKKLGNLDQETSKREYIKLVSSLDPEFNPANKISSKEGWVCVSTLQQNNEDQIQDDEKTLTDYIKEGLIDKCEELLSSLKNKEDVINKIDENGLGLIHWAADRGSIDLLKSLVLKHNASVNLKDQDGQTALHYASSCGHLDCVQFLLENNSDPFLQDSDGMSPIDLASDDKVKEILSSIKAL